MKKILLLCGLFILAIGTFAQETKKVAILEPVDKEGKLSYGQKLMLRSNLAKAVTNTAGYEAYDRSDVDAIMGEQDFQRTGMVSDEQIRKLGEMTGVAYILVSEGALTEDKKMIVAVKLLNVETARVEMTDNTIMKTSTEDIQRGCEALAANLFGSSTVHAQKNKALKKTAEKESTKKKIKSVVIEEDNSQYTITRINNNEYQYMGRKLIDKEYEALLKNCPQAYDYYKNGKVLSNTGWTMLAVGGTLGLFGGLLESPYIRYDIEEALYGDAVMWSPFSRKILTVGTGLICVGSAAIVVSIPLLCVGYNRMHNAHNIYNNSCIDSPAKQLSLNLTAGQNGLGLALQF